ncbi:type VI secretion system-associated FHA domain protein TagH [Novosphingobium sp.]|uniref:type VI secretion system-associated FHA domain protein TagH n=1 Tax=Novosphingobium sp. TaxID=1874826 RepID=UPI00286D8F76|nr:type VI secretion system-associated FHA domain protein TagH [Novosphingobium sp.]
MTLTLSLRNVSSLADGGPVELRLDRRGAIIGRSPTVDWTLPDPTNYISSRHCEVRFEDETYLLRDTSTNGTVINGTRMNGPHRLANGDILVIGQYEVSVSAPGGAAAPAPASQAWGGWKDVAATTSDASAGSDWGKPKAKAALAGDGVLGANWEPPSVASPSPFAAGGPSLGAPPPAAPQPWQPEGLTPPVPAAPPAPPADAWGVPTPGSDWNAGSNSDWSQNSPVNDPSAPSTGQPAGRDIWGELASAHTADWSRSSFGIAGADNASGGLGLSPVSGADALGALPPPPPSANPAYAAPAAPQAQAPAAAAPPQGQPSAEASAEALLEQIAPLLGLTRADLHGEPAGTFAAMANLMRRLVSGLVVMVEARARAKAQLGAQNTILQFDGNNPIKFSRTPEQALAQLLNPAERGFMSADRAIDDAYSDLQAHQMATLKAMQGALRATLDRFSPHAISSRVQSKGLLAQILPGKRDAALWKAYEKEFSGVSQGSDEAFMEVFAKEFKKAYEDEAARRR